MMGLEDIARRQTAKTSALPQPPRGYAPGQDDAGRPPCARCVREGGIVLHGRRVPPQRSDVHPDHTHAHRDKGGRVSGFAHHGPREPLCSHHVELVAWECLGGNRGAPKPAWARGQAT